MTAEIAGRTRPRSVFGLCRKHPTSQVAAGLSPPKLPLFLKARLLDIMMPDINGHEVCKKIKSNPETGHIKIIVLSAYLDDDNYKEMKNYGADACFSKPLPLP